jgi:hypothetical protein
MSLGRTISLCAWAAVIAAWALPQNGTAQKSSGFTPVPGKVERVQVQPPADFAADKEVVDRGIKETFDAAEDFAVDAVIQRIDEHAAARPGGPWPHDAVLVDHLGEELGPADYAALANPSMRGLLPPVEYAHPYHGRVLLLRGANQEAMRWICGKQPEGVLLGCARRPNANGVPFVALADHTTIVQNGWTENLDALHEAGHLNGSWTHDGWRDLAQLGRPIEAPKPVVVAQADAPPPEDDQYIEAPPPRRHPRPRYRDYPPAPPPGVLVEPWTGRTVPCALTVLTFGMLPVCI